MISSLEKQFSVKLFERSGRSVRLTVAGQTLNPMAQELIFTAGRIAETVMSLQIEVSEKQLHRKIYMARNRENPLTRTQQLFWDCTMASNSWLLVKTKNSPMQSSQEQDNQFSGKECLSCKIGFQKQCR